MYSWILHYSVFEVWTIKLPKFGGDESWDRIFEMFLKPLIWKTILRTKPIRNKRGVFDGISACTKRKRTRLTNGWLSVNLCQFTVGRNRFWRNYVIEHRTLQDRACTYEFLKMNVFAIDVRTFKFKFICWNHPCKNRWNNLFVSNFTVNVFWTFGLKF